MSDNGTQHSVQRNRIKAQLQIARDKAVELGRETTEILDRGYYLTASGTRVDIEEQVEASVRGTVSYPPTHLVHETKNNTGSILVEVMNETTLEAAKYLIARGYKPASLNFASATSPGGGFLSGARAQEEYLARTSALWACIRDNAMYPYHRGRKDPFYSDYVIYSPDVLVFRGDDGGLLEAPYPCSMITSPAVNATAVRRYCPEREDEIPAAMWNRILKVLAVARKHGHNALVLGAWGCGAFGNSSEDIARLFRKALQEHFAGEFDHVVFAITDWSEGQYFIKPFLREFEG